MEINECLMMSIDWFQGVFYNVDFSYIFHDFLGLSHVPFEDPAVMKAMEYRLGYDWQLGYNYEGIIVTTHKNNLLTAQDDASDVFHYVFEHIQLKISGDGMRFLRSVVPDIEYRLHKQMHIDHSCGTFHITRCDFAFDFLNYRTDILGELQSYLDQLYWDGARAVPVLSSKCPLKYSMRTGDQSTCYIGGTRGNKLLRVYDKLIESNGDLSKLPCEVDFPVDSWCRVELQTRNEYSHKLLYGTNDGLIRLKELHTLFLFCDSERNPLAWWRDLIDWDTIGSIVQNAKYVEPVLTKSKLENRLDSLLDALLPYCAATDGAWEQWLITNIRRRSKDLCAAGHENSYRYRNFLFKTAILRDCPVDDDGKLIGSFSCVSSSHNLVTILRGKYQLLQLVNHNLF